jgi:hypothetical protein
MRTYERMIKMKKFKAKHKYGTEWEFLVQINEKFEISFDIVKMEKQ